MKIINKLVTTLTIIFFLMIATVVTSTEKKHLRPMEKHKVTELGLELWTEFEPKWDIKLNKVGKKNVFYAETPANYYPPAVMTWVSFQGMEVVEGELEEIARTAILTAAHNYKAKVNQEEKITPVQITYNELTGYEATFSGVANGEEVDVKIFVGHKPGKGPVAMQVYTLKGKLPHLSEQIRRSWNNVKYLN